jgi:hypothetical protein
MAKLMQVLDVQSKGAVAVIFVNSDANDAMPLNFTPGVQRPEIPAVSVGRRVGMLCAHAALSGFGCDAFIMPVCFHSCKRTAEELPGRCELPPVTSKQTAM